MAQPVSSFTITDHAREEMERRGISEALVEAVLRAPRQRERVRDGRDVLQIRIWEDAKQYLIRVFVDVDPIPAEVVTAYKTSKIAKYWRPER